MIAVIIAITMTDIYLMLILIIIAIVVIFVAIVIGIVHVYVCICRVISSSPGSLLAFIASTHCSRSSRSPFCREMVIRPHHISQDKNPMTSKSKSIVML